MSSANEPAFPNLSAGFNNMWPEVHGSGGLTKREYFAAMAMKGILSGVSEGAIAYDGWNFDKISRFSVAAAESILAELEK